MPEDDVQKLDKNSDMPTANDGKTYTDEQLAELAEKSGDTVEHMKEMLGLYNTGDKKVDNSDNKEVDNNVDKDKLLAGKFKTTDDLNTGIQNLIDKFGAEKAYKMLESNIGKGDTDDGTKDALSDDGSGKGTNADKEPDALNTDDDNNQKGQEETIDLAKFAEEYADNGKLSDETYKKLADAGLDKGTVDSYIAGQEAISQLYTSNVTDYAGGEEQYIAMVDWGTQNLSDAEKSKFNDAINSGNLETAKTVIDALKARYEASEGTFNRNTVTPSDNISGNAVQGYQSVQEMQKDMADPRYRAGDQAFINQVKAKIKASKAL